MLTLKYDLCVINGCTQLQFSENTGIYTLANPGGWGTPNIEIGNVVTATLLIKGPDGVEYTIDLTIGNLPSNIVGFSYNIPLVSMGSPITITDGQWYFVYTVIDDNDVEYSTTVNKYFTCNTKCCISNMLAKVNTCDSCPKDDSEELYNKAKTMFDSLENAAECGDLTTFNSIKKIIDKLCLNSGCKTCK